MKVGKKIESQRNYLKLKKDFKDKIVESGKCFKLKKQIYLKLKKMKLKILI